jgi:hypothetical protein
MFCNKYLTWDVTLLPLQHISFPLTSIMRFGIKTFFLGELLEIGLKEPEEMDK